MLQVRLRRPGARAGPRRQGSRQGLLTFAPRRNCATTCRDVTREDRLARADRAAGPARPPARFANVLPEQLGLPIPATRRSWRRGPLGGRAVVGGDAPALAVLASSSQIRSGICWDASTAIGSLKTVCGIRCRRIRACVRPSLCSSAAARFRPLRQFIHSRRSRRRSRAPSASVSPGSSCSTAAERSCGGSGRRRGDDLPPRDRSRRGVPRGARFLGARDRRRGVGALRGLEVVAAPPLLQVPPDGPDQRSRAAKAPRRGTRAGDRGRAQPRRGPEGSAADSRRDRYPHGGDRRPDFCSSRRTARSSSTAPDPTKLRPPVWRAF